ncbi:J domain-containing protein spf31 [Penicillium subrubescens]|jgi:DnaJ family protein C protein 8|uniref:J domain-containing protein spf31 n=1 Tax=Penicillium subrubescens TaxID=1316194 RepID=A0A1Q5TQL2_9EURO|nr:J domain-containing protein spf31 [Penicillium subrubescens]KAJ5900518.1 J domain-containing protein spf31 [Penicillium subrubescens]OKP02518.1 J domain-containing protein spf31 [Penicillium subrubescens]
MADDEVDQDVFDSLEREASEFTKDAEIDRIRSAFSLDAYAVLDLQPGVTEKDIKVQYRKKSLLIHPDKTKNPAAPDAFDRLKKAQTALLDEKQRTYLDECIADARRLLIREHKYTLDSPELQTEEFKVEWRKKAVHVLLEEEARRRRQAKARMQEEGREKRKEEEELEARKRKRDQDKAWEDTREERIGTWRDWQKGHKTGDEKKKKKKMKVLG